MSSISLLIRRKFCSSSSSLQSVSRIIYKESNLKNVVETFKKYTEIDTFRLKSTFYEHTVQRLANAKRYDWIEEILEEQKKYKDIKKEGFVVRLITLYGKSGMFDHAHKLFDEMPELDCVRTVKSLNALLTACVSSRKYDMVDGFFRELPRKLGVKPDVVSYNIVIKGLCKMGSFDSAVSMLDEMKREGVSPGLISFNILFDGLYKNGRIVDGEKVWGLMDEYDVVPDIMSYNMKLYGLVSEKRTQEAMDLVEEIKTKELKPDVFTFNTLLKGLCDDGSCVEDVERWYREMVKVKCVPTHLTFATLLTFACDKADFVFAARVCRGMFYFRRKLNEVVVVQKVVNGLVKQSHRKEAELLVRLGKESKHSCYHGLKMPQEDEC